jgi:chemotaxis response regulator CheB
MDSCADEDKLLLLRAVAYAIQKLVLCVVSTGAEREGLGVPLLLLR